MKRPVSKRSAKRTSSGEKDSVLSLVQTEKVTSKCVTYADGYFLGERVAILVAPAFVTELIIDLTDASSITFEFAFGLYTGLGASNRHKVKVTCQHFFQSLLDAARTLLTVKTANQPGT